MKKDIEWIKDKLSEIAWEENKSQYLISLEDAYKVIEQLKEPEVLSQEESINIVLQDLKEYIKEQQSLSQNVGLAHTPAGNGTYYKQYDYVLQCIDEYESSDELQNLIMPKQEVLSQEWIDDNTFVVTDEDGDDYAMVGHSTLRSLLVPKQELPVIPQYVADWIKAERGTMSNWKLPSRFISDSKYKKDQRRYKWSQVEGNMDKFMSALINGYEVEEEPLYHALIKGHDVSDDYDVYWNCHKSERSVFVSGLHPLHDNFTTEMSKSEWNELGINDSNADFVRA